MPYVNVRITRDGVTAEQKAAIVREITDTLVRVLGIRDILVVGRDSEEEPLFAVTAAGCLPYFSELPALDMLGLNDRHIAHHRPPAA